MPGMIAPLHPQAVVYPIFAFPSWILCIAPLVWHYSQGNIAAGSIILWVMMNNFFNSINPLIWPRDNLDEWWNGNIWCDMHVRIQVGSVVGITMSAVMILRKLAKVMDTSNIIVSSGRNSRLKEQALDVLCCWLFPLFLILIYYVVQSERYMIYGIVGCRSAFDTSWLSFVLNFMWAPITACVATGYACLLCYRLYRYRREFSRLISARNTTKSRFIRLFIICLFVVVLYTPWAMYVVADIIPRLADSYSWSRVHEPRVFNSVVKIPSFGIVTIDKWAQVFTGYLMFLLFGTGSDAYNMYKNALLAIGLGKIFPSLYAPRNSSSMSLPSFIVAREWTSSLPSKAKSMFSSRTDSTTDTIDESTRGSTVIMEPMPQLRSVSSEQPILKQERTQQHSPPAKPSFFERVFDRQHSHRNILPLFVHRSVMEINDANANKPGSRNVSQGGVSTYAWAARKPSSRVGAADGVRVVHEVHMDRQESGAQGKGRKSADDWA